MIITGYMLEEALRRRETDFRKMLHERYIGEAEIAIGAISDVEALIRTYEQTCRVSVKTGGETKQMSLCEAKSQMRHYGNLVDELHFMVVSGVSDSNLAPRAALSRASTILVAYNIAVAEGRAYKLDCVEHEIEFDPNILA